MSAELPRIVVAAPASGHGKTTVATGLMLALRRSGLRVSGHKVGPDYIDPGYHALATGRPGRNLDPHLVGEDRVVPLLLHGASTAGAGSLSAGPASAGVASTGLADVAVIEGVMGLYDGHIGGDGFASTAHVAELTASPVILVVDISHASRSIAAVVLGMATYEPGIRIAGVVLNKAGSQRHSDEVRRALQPLGIPVLGVLHRDDGVTAPSRHLGLVPAAERPEAARSLDHLAAKVADAIDLEAVVRIARSAPALPAPAWSAFEALTGAARDTVGGAVGDAVGDTAVGGQPGGGDDDTVRPLVAVAGGRAFTFRYAETVELLEAAGCSVAQFDPTADDRLPEGTSGIYLGGGFPEVHAAELSSNAPMLRSLRTATAAGVPTVAECAGLLYLCRSLDGVPMVGAVDADAAMTPRLTLAYRRSTAASDSVLASAGTEVTGHEFHRTAITAAAGADTQPRPTRSKSGAAPAWTSTAGPEGFVTGSVHASYLHTHWAGYPALAARFAARAHRYSQLSLQRA